MVAGPVGEVLLVTKPVGAPWEDGTLRIVRGLAEHLVRYEPRLLGRRGDPWRPPRGEVEALHGPARGWRASPSADRARTLGRLMEHRGESLRHFVFAPSPPTARAAALSRRVRGRIPVIQTVPSRPRRFDPALVFGDLLVVTSAWSEARWRQEARVSSLRLRRVPPPVPLPPEPPEGRVARTRRRLGLPVDAPLLLYPGDLALGGEAAARAITGLAPLPDRLDVHLLMACRSKTRKDTAEQGRLIDLARRRRVADRVRWLGRVDDFPDLLAAVDLVVLPATETYGKVDLPLALLEAMAVGTPVVVPDEGPLAELAEDGAAAAVPVTEADALGTTVAGLLDDEPGRRRMGRAGRRRVAAAHDPVRLARRYEELYDEVVG